MSEDGKVGNWIAGVLFERRRKGEQGKARRLISGLFAAAISGALVVLLADYLLSRIVPEYWPPGHRWAVAGGGATGAVLQSLWTWLKSRRKPESSN